jgi:hypothetical protein
MEPEEADALRRLEIQDIRSQLGAGGRSPGADAGFGK